jgi:hypothetical protein
MADYQIERADLIRVVPGSDGLLCPICLRSEKMTHFTEGHIFPAECRNSNAAVPECVTCNNDLGSGVDAALGMVATFLLLTEGINNPVQAKRLYGRRLTVGGTSAVVLSSQMSAGRHQLHLGYRGNPPKHLELPGGLISLPMQAEFGHSNMISGGLLHSAVLRVFHYFGYSYILSPCIKPIQTSLIQASLYKANSMQAGATLGIFWNATRLLVDLPEKSDRLFIARDIDGHPLAFAAFVRYTTQKGGLALIPGPRLEDYISYNRILHNEVSHILLDPVLPIYERGVRLMSGKGREAMFLNWGRHPQLDKASIGFQLPSGSMTYSVSGIAAKSSLLTDITFERLPEEGGRARSKN